MNHNVDISIVMGVFNPRHPKRLFRAVQSILDQTLSSWELILYDDGSDEEEARIIRQAAAMDERIVYIRGRLNRGLAHALNTGIQRSSGRYIARMDDDDISRPDRLARQYAFLETHPEYDWVGSCASLMDARGIWGLQTVPQRPQKADFLHNSPYIHPTILFRREVLVENGGYSTAREVLHCEDYELFLRLHRRGYQGYNLQQPLLQYWEDAAAYKKRTYRRRIREAGLRYREFRAWGLLSGRTVGYVLKPLLVGAIPAPLHHSVKRWLRRSPSRDDGRVRKPS